MSNNIPFYAAMAAAFVYANSKLDVSKSYNTTPQHLKRNVADDKDVYHRAQMGARYARLTKPRQIAEWDSHGR